MEYYAQNNLMYVSATILQPSLFPQAISAWYLLYTFVQSGGGALGGRVHKGFQKKFLMK